MHQMRVVMYHLLRKYEIYYDEIPSEVDLTFGITLQPTNGLHVKFRPINDSYYWNVLMHQRHSYEALVYSITFTLIRSGMNVTFPLFPVSYIRELSEYLQKRLWVVSTFGHKSFTKILTLRTTVAPQVGRKNMYKTIN